MNRFARRRPRLGDLAITFAVSSALTLALFWPARRTLNAPVGGGDALAHYATGFLTWTETRFGYPFGMTAFPYFPSTDLIQRAFASAAYGVTGDRFLSVNLVWILSFPLTALAAWWVLRLSGATRLLAVALAVSFSFIPYHVFRGLDHLYLAAMWSVPLAVGLALLTGRGEMPRLLGTSWRSHARAALAATCLVVAWSGIYYAFFACLLMTAALVWLFAHGASRRVLAKSAIPLAVVGGGVLVVLLGAAIANSLDPPTSMVASRQPSESALYSGNLAFALTPSPLTDVPLLAGPASRFESYVRPELEGYGYGQFGTVVTSVSAAIVLLGLVVLARRRVDRQQLPTASGHGHGLHLALLATSVVFFVPWSLNFSFALLVTPEIRAWDRFLPIILLLMMTSAVSLAGAVLPRSGTGLRAASAIVIVVLTLFDGITPYVDTVSSRFQAGDERLRAATVYASRVNVAAPESCGVLQFPYVPFPEKAAAVPEMEDYEHFLVALANPGKQWSYGGIKYTTASLWAANLGDKLTEESVASLVEGGFCGVHLDRTGYPVPRATAVAASVERLLGPPAAEGLDGRWQFFVLPIDGRQSRDVRDRQSLTPSAERFYHPRSSN